MGNGESVLTITSAAAAARLVSRRRRPIEDLQDEQDQQESLWNLLPDEVLLLICQHLTADDLRSLQLVCRRWNVLTNDCAMWRRRLRVTYSIWFPSTHVIEELLLPYPRCPVNQIIRDPNHLMTCLQLFRVYEYRSILKNLQLAAGKAFRLLFFGLGLESNNTKKISRLILDSRNSTFEAFGMCNGLERGIGCGTKVKYRAKHHLHFLTLYTDVKCAREKIGKRGESGDIFQKWTTTCGAGEWEENLGLRDSSSQLNATLRKLLQTVDGLVYVADATLEDVSEDEALAWQRRCRECLSLFADDEGCPKVPLLVLSCHEHPEVRFHTCQEQVEFLDLGRLWIPWSVCAVDVQSSRGLEQAFDWLLSYMYMSAIDK